MYARQRSGSLGESFSVIQLHAATPGSIKDGSFTMDGGLRFSSVLDSTMSPKLPHSATRQGVAMGKCAVMGSSWSGARRTVSSSGRWGSERSVLPP